MVLEIEPTLIPALWLIAFALIINGALIGYLEYVVKTTYKDIQTKGLTLHKRWINDHEYEWVFTNRKDLISQREKDVYKIKEVIRKGYFLIEIDENTN